LAVEAEVPMAILVLLISKTCDTNSYEKYREINFFQDRDTIMHRWTVFHACLHNLRALITPIIVCNIFKYISVMQK